MSKKWWGVTIAAFLVGASLVGVGFYLFETRSFLENLIAEAIGLTFGFGIIILLIEGPVLTRQRRARAIREYQRQVFQVAAGIGDIFVMEIAKYIARDFEPPIDLDGLEPLTWNEQELLLRKVFKNAVTVRQDGVPARHRLDEEIALSIMESALKMESEIRATINLRPEFHKWEILGGLDLLLLQIVNQVKDAKRLNLLNDPIERYSEIGQLGYSLLEMFERMNLLSKNSELW